MRRPLGILAALSLLITGCSTTPPTGSAPPSDHATAPPTSSGTPAEPSASTAPSARQCAARLVDAMSTDERIGQLVMAGVSSASAAELAVVDELHLGSVIIMGNHSGIAGVRAMTKRLAETDGSTPVLVAVDQEGGLVQRLKGDGFDTIPAARTQAEYGNGTLREKAKRWAGQLREAGVRWDLAPVADTVPADMTTSNKPIGALRRGFGADPDTVGAKVAAVVRGMDDAGVATAPKHFPGIGRVVGNTDFAAGVKDTVTTADDPYLKPFREAVRAGAGSLMVSTVTYTRIDPKRAAAFSPTVIGLIRAMGFDKVVISDDLGVAKSVSNVPVKQRAARFVAAGGDVAITVDPALADEFVAGLKAAASEQAMAQRITESAIRVVELKVDLGLARCG